MRRGIDVMFATSFKLCATVNSALRTPRGCDKKHSNHVVSGEQGVVYCVPLSCGKEYAGQASSCLNQRLRERQNNVGKLALSGVLVAHCVRCGYEPLFSHSRSLAGNTDRLARETLGALEIKIKSKTSVNCRPVALTEKEVQFLSR